MVQLTGGRVMLDITLPDGIHRASRKEWRLVGDITAEAFAEDARMRLQTILHRALVVLEGNNVPGSCIDMLLPVLKKAKVVAQDGSSERCRIMEGIVSARLDQIAEDFFRK